MRVPNDFGSKRETELVVRIKHPMLGELESAKKLKDLPAIEVEK